MKTTLGVIFGNRDFFPDHLVSEARKDIQALFQEMSIEGVMLGEDETKLGSVETYAHSKACADLFRANRERIEGILVVLPNFGDEKGVADTIKLSGLNVPILVQAYPDDLGAFNVERRRDAFCGKISVCNNLRQYGYAFSLTSLHTSRPNSESFKQDLKKFVSICKVVNGLRSVRLGAIGARPGSFQTVRYSEKILQASGITVTTIDLSEILGDAARLKDDSPRVKAKLETIQSYAKHSTVPSPAMLRMAKLGLVIDDWMQANDLQATALQCWTSMQKNYGVNACTLMSMMSNQLLPSACEVDITGVVSMYALQLASGSPAALVDWNNNYADDPDRCVFFHCGNWAKSFVPDLEIKTAPILGTTLGEENTFGAMSGRAAAGNMTYARVSTDDSYGMVRAYTGQGEITDDPLDTFGHRAVIHTPDLQKLLAYLCQNGFEHHVAMTMGHVSDALDEAFTTYMGWENYKHS
ncbi:L-fucose/L-arabinose isomerase family protein [Levilinea saccharolytica]|uniref:Fucose isomerase n=1 Tax=Levilinea saccharolytica TaxID=229921 RepID=A0A0M8JQ71_9CHLR|nr:L-fucose/L-arabinose isomerase family protein [Levilinea saccharolytica]KPL91544.1 fucose isomerase [Levilinea saccharolytica]GAP19128.1 L-fucose isomerase [Levilinea saccharolytica]